MASAKQKEIDRLTAALEEPRADLDDRVSNVAFLSNEIDEREAEIQALKDEIVEKNELLRNKELTRFAKEYENQENRYAGQQRQWFIFSLIMATVLMVVVLATIFIIPSTSIYPDPETVFLNIILLTIFLYCLRQHSHLANLRDDYANRKALAQSYQYMVEEDDGVPPTEMETLFLQKAADTFTRRPASRGKDITITDAVIAKLIGNKSP